MDYISPFKMSNLIVTKLIKFMFNSIQFNEAQKKKKMNMFKYLQLIYS